LGGFKIKQINLGTPTNFFVVASCDKQTNV
jgi:hypothetical protein